MSLPDAILNSILRKKRDKNEVTAYKKNIFKLSSISMKSNSKSSISLLVCRMKIIDPNELSINSLEPPTIDRK